ncbi:MAG: hypothetical protein V4706_02825 [Pseudomonadota bacterium]
MKRSILCAAALAAVLLLAACDTVPKVPAGKVAVAIECREPEPARPNMPTEALKARGCPSGECVDELLQASLAENLRREGYEGQLRTALRVCTAPIAGSASEYTGGEANR